ncbi:MAG: molecular chaperone TorD family protein [Candidatus Hydrogenedentota bacterium]
MKDEVMLGKLAALAALIGYPDARIGSVAASAWAADACPNDESRAAMMRFSSIVAVSTLSDMEELFTRTFDINPVCSFEIGWHLFGEQYERGAFMVRMRGLMRQFDIEESAELPDHLAHALLLIDRMPSDEAAKLAREILPAVVKMLDGLSDRKAEGNPYRDLMFVIMEAIRTICMKDAESDQSGLPAGPCSRRDHSRFAASGSCAHVD